MRTYIVHKLGPKNWAIRQSHRSALSGIVSFEVSRGLKKRQALLTARLLAGRSYKVVIEGKS